MKWDENIGWTPTTQATLPTASAATPAPAPGFFQPVPSPHQTLDKTSQYQKTDQENLIGTKTKIDWKPDTTTKDEILSEALKKTKPNKINIISNVIIRPERQEVKVKTIVVNKEEVKQVLNIIVETVVENYERDAKLKIISDKIRNRMLKKYVEKWKSVVGRLNRKRKQFFDSPSWVASKSLKEIANEFYTPSQNQIYDNIKRYKTGTSTFKTPEIVRKKINKMNVPVNVWKILYDKTNKDLCMYSNIFWKIGVSLKINNKFTLNFVNNFLYDMFDWKYSNNTIRTVDKSIINRNSFTYSIEKISKITNDLNGLLFIVESDTLNNFYEEFSETITKQKRFTPILIIIINSQGYFKDEIVDELDLENLKKESYLTEYEVVLTDSNLTVPLMIASMKWLAHNVAQTPPLKLNTCCWLLEVCAGEEFWDRINASANINQRFQILLKDPNIVIRLYNKALDKLLLIVQHPELKIYNDFPNEFKNVTSDLIMLPCDSEYFPEDWRTDVFMNNIKTVIKTAYLPEYTEIWPPKNLTEFELNIKEYCSQVFDKTNNAFNIIRNKFMFLYEDFSDITTIVWSDILTIIVTEKINEIRLNSEVLAVYKECDVNEFRRAPWWYTTTEILTKIKTIDLKENLSEDDYDDDDDDTVEISINDTILDVEKSLMEDDKNSEIIKDFNDLREMVEDLEQSLKIEKKIMVKFDETANSILNDPLFSNMNLF